MKLTDYEKRMLDGTFGQAKRKALEVIVRYGRIVEAEQLCAVTWADLFCGAHAYLEVVQSDDFDDVFSRMALCSAESVVLDSMAPGCTCYSGIEPDCTERPEHVILAPGQQKKNLANLNRFVHSGVILSGNCIPYLTGFVPLRGEHFVSCESSAVLLMNSLWGTCANGDGLDASFCSAVCGRTPLWGMHVPSGRIGTDVVEIKSAPETVNDWDLLGYTIGQKLPAFSVPVLTGGFQRPNIFQMKAFCAALACAAGTELCHIVGLTPEAPSVEAALGNAAPRSRITIDPADVIDARDRLCSSERIPIDYITLGCPHYHIEELRQIAQFFENKRIHSGVKLEIWTTGPFKYMADRCGYTKTIEGAGGTILMGSCPASRGVPDGTRAAAYDSAKMRMDAMQLTDIKSFYGSMAQCLNAALTGYWEATP